MSLNTEVLTTLVGKLKIVTLIIGVIDLGLTADKYARRSSEEFFLAMVIICFIISLIWTLLYVVGIVQESELLTKIDFLYHGLGGLLLFIAMICWFVSVVDIGGRGGWYVQRIFAGLFGLANAPLYIFIAYLLFRRSGLGG